MPDFQNFYKVSVTKTMQHRGKDRNILQSLKTELGQYDKLILNKVTREFNAVKVVFSTNDAVIIGL